jgi:hypothetical protein
MYNTDLPRRADLPTAAQLKRSTIIAAISALVILVTIVLPSEYAIDLTGFGRLTGLTEMGEIKIQLASEAAADTAKVLENQPATPAEEAPAEAAQSSAQNATVAATEAPPSPSAGRSDEVSFTLAPGQGAEIKLVMREDAQATFAWSSSGGPVNFDTHGDAAGKSTSYEKGRGVTSDEGILEAAFDGNHGWFWRNRTDADVTITLRTSGDYSELKRLL